MASGVVCRRRYGKTSDGVVSVPESDESGEWIGLILTSDVGCRYPESNIKLVESKKKSTKSPRKVQGKFR